MGLALRRCAREETDVCLTSLHLTPDPGLLGGQNVRRVLVGGALGLMQRDGRLKPHPTLDLGAPAMDARGLPVQPSSAGLQPEQLGAVALERGRVAPSMSFGFPRPRAGSAASSA